MRVDLANYVSDPAIVRADEHDRVITVLDEKHMRAYLRKALLRRRAAPVGRLLLLCCLMQMLRRLKQALTDLREGMWHTTDGARPMQEARKRLCLTKLPTNICFGKTKEAGAS